MDDSKQILNERYYATLTTVASETILQETPKRDLPSVTNILNVTMSAQSKMALEKWKKNMIEKLGEDGFNKYSKGIYKMTKLLYCLSCLRTQTIIINRSQ